MSETRTASVPPVLAGPILRRVQPARVTLWLATRAPANVRVDLHAGDAGERIERRTGDAGLLHLAAGERLHYLMLDLPLERPLPRDEWVGYRVALELQDDLDAGWQDATDWAPGLCYPGRETPGFVIPSRIGAVLHGSCRKPHHDTADGLVTADRWLGRRAAVDAGAEHLDAWPSALVMSGDQIYADDVAGPLLVAIHRLIERLGLPGERLDTLGVGDLRDSAALYAHPDTYYRRENLLPQQTRRSAVFDVLFGGIRKPVFTTDSAQNHLVTLAEVLAMYLLVWSPAAWEGLEIATPEGLTEEERQRFALQRKALDEFVAGLSAVRRLLAHVPAAMVFDDHDVSDDWNLNREWEEAAYGHPLSRRIIGNALLAYLLNQGWGNRPEAFDTPLLEHVARALREPGSERHDTAIEALLRFQGWDYEWPTAPPLIVLDTRTRRWRSEGAAHRPSGLLDWEAVTDLQRALHGHDAVLLVSAPPVFGVKLIELLQRSFTWFGKPLLVDAENWMAHPGTGNAILNVFRHPKTPRHFVILSGDVHYSFVYDVELRGQTGGPHIWQICSSGLRNTFPERLLAVLDHLNRWLYSPRSPLNWLTRRRRMRVIPRKPVGSPSGRRLLNEGGIGLVELGPDGAPVRISQVVAGETRVDFVPREDESHWD